MTVPLAEQAHAKLNLALHLRHRRPDGYHELDTLFAFTAGGDRLTAIPANIITLTVDGPTAGGLAVDDTNLVLRAARALAAATGCDRGAALHLDKRLPVASGIGGGSADAAAALRLLSRLWDVAIPPDLPGTLGADVPACLLARTAYATGRGWPLVPAPQAERLAGTPVLLVNPRVPLSTAAVFRAWDGVDRGPLGRGDPLAAALAGRNDMEAAAVSLVPAIGLVLSGLAAAPGVTLARMSGSGATCFALFDSPAARDNAAARWRTTRPGDWTMATALI